jgi:hypothetical protein
MEEANSAASAYSKTSATSVSAFLHEGDEVRWLSAPAEEVVAMAAPFPSQLMTVV